MLCGGTFIPAWIVWAVIVFLGVTAFGGWSKIWTWAKSLWTSTTGKTVSTTLDSQVNTWLTNAKSAKVQGLLRLVAIEFKAKGDTASEAQIDALIASAAAWKDEG